MVLQVDCESVSVVLQFLESFENWPHFLEILLDLRFGSAEWLDLVSSVRKAGGERARTVADRLVVECKVDPDVDQIGEGSKATKVLTDSEERVPVKRPF